MANIAKTVVATGASSGLGFEVIKQLLEQTQPYRFILGCRDTTTTQHAFDALKYDSGKHSLTILPLELSDLRTVRTFASKTVQELGDRKLDYLFLNAGMAHGNSGPGPNGSEWSASYVVNHLSQHYLITLLREKLVSSSSRLVVVSSGAARMVKETDSLTSTLKAHGNKGPREVYPASKFVQLLGALYWKRQLAETSCSLVAVSPGLIPDTGLGRNHPEAKLSMSMPDAKTVEVGAQSLIRAFTVSDIPTEKNRIFLTSWGEWWETDMYSLALDGNLQDKWSPSKEGIEREANL